MIPIREYPNVETIYPAVSPLFMENFLSTAPVVINQGGTSSGKTYSILQVLAQRLIDYDNTLCTVVGQDIPNLKDGSYNDFKDIVSSTPKLEYAVERHNKSDREITLKNGSRIQFKAYDDYQDAKNGKRDFLFANEANGIGFEVFEELQARTRLQTFIDYNPNAEFWLHDKVLNNPKYPIEYQFIKSDWRDNPFIPIAIKNKILSYKDTDPYRWKVYGLGELGQLEGLVYPDWIEQKEHPSDYDYTIYGLDFGFTNDPTALVRCDFSGRNIYLTTLIYETGLTNHQLLAKMHSLGLKQGDIIYADCAEPKSIAEITTGTREIKGIYCAPAVKGSDSLRAGINKLSDYKIHYLNTDPIRKERNNYVWDKDANGKALNKPIDAFNHALDAARYAIFTNSFTKRGEKKGK